MAKIDQRLFSAHEQALVREHQTCPRCGDKLVVRHGKHGPFLGCAGYPDCDYVRPLSTQTTSGEGVEKVLDGTACPDCGHPLAIKKGRYGLFIGCSHYPHCQHVESANPEEPALLPCPACGKGHLMARTSRYGKTFYACDAYPKCKYGVNDPPVAETCPQCGWGILVEKQTRQGRRHCCPQKMCTFQSELL